MILKKYGDFKINENINEVSGFILIDEKYDLYFYNSLDELKNDHKNAYDFSEHHGWYDEEGNKQVFYFDINKAKGIAFRIKDGERIKMSSLIEPGTDFDFSILTNESEIYKLEFTDSDDGETYLIFSLSKFKQTTYDSMKKHNSEILFDGTEKIIKK